MGLHLEQKGYFVRISDMAAPVFCWGHSNCLIQIIPSGCWQGECGVTALHTESFLQCSSLLQQTHTVSCWGENRTIVYTVNLFFRYAVQYCLQNTVVHLQLSLRLVRLGRKYLMNKFLMVLMCLAFFNLAFKSRSEDRLPSCNCHYLRVSQLFFFILWFCKWFVSTWGAETFRN